MTLLLILATVAVVAIVGVGAVSFPLVPSFFGLYGDARKTPHGRFLMLLIACFPLIAAASLFLAWRSTAQNTQLVVFAPFAYIVFIWLIRANKQDTSSASKRFKKQSDNSDEQLREISYKWDSWSHFAGGNATLVVEAYFPKGDLYGAFESEAKLKFKNSFSSKSDHVTEKNMMFFSVVVGNFSRALLENKMSEIMNLVWRHQGEISSIEVER